MTDLTVTVTGYRELQKALKNYAPVARKELNKELKAAMGPVLSDARSNASWSTRIPGALSVSATMKGVGLKVSRKKAPHGSIYERGTRKDRKNVAHVLFGNYDYWYRTPVRPFMQPALDRNKGQVLAASAPALRRAASKVNL